MHRIRIVAALALSLGAAWGQRGPRPQAVRFLGAEPGRPAQIVKGMPYSAEVTSENVQTLRDGNTIHQTNIERVYRDGEGRTRREPSLASLGSPAAPQLAFIDDPVAGASYVLDLGNHTATRRAWREPPPNAPPGPPRPRPASSNNTLKTESLGRQTIAGVPADGTRITETIPAGQIGNVLPIQIVTETWYSPDLQAVILEKRTDPRVGESTLEWKNISRAEPPATLFAIPSDYPVLPKAGPRGRRGREP